MCLGGVERVIQVAVELLGLCMPSPRGRPWVLVMLLVGVGVTLLLLVTLGRLV